MTEAQITVLAALVGSSVALVGSAVRYAIQRRHARIDAEEAARRARYQRLLAISARFGQELQTLRLTGHVYSRWFTGVRTLTRTLPPPPGPLEIGDRFGRYNEALFEVWSEAWLAAWQDEIDHISAFMGEVAQVTDAALNGADILEAQQRLASARRDLADFARKKLGKQPVRLLVEGR